MLEALARALRDHFVIDAVTSKGDCFDLLRVNEFELIVACERLEDGSGLELLGQVAKRWPATLRVFSADRERLKLLQGRLGPFQLFQTLAYPIDPRKLFATLSLAAAAHNAEADTVNFENVELSSSDADPPPPEPVSPPRAAPVSRAGQPGRRSRPRAGGAARAEGAARTAEPNNSPRAAGRASPRERSQPDRAPARSGERTVNRRVQSTSSSELIAAATAEDAAAIAAAARSNIDPLGEKTTAGHRGVVMIGGGAVVAAIAIALLVKLFSGSDHSAAKPTAAAQSSPHYSQAVTDLVSAIEAEFTRDDFSHVQADVDQLRNLAPDHPRLPFFDSLLNRLTGKTRVLAKGPAAPETLKPAPGNKSSQRHKGTSDEAASAPSLAATAGSPPATSGPAVPVITPAPSVPIPPSQPESPPPTAVSPAATRPAVATVAAQPTSSAPETATASTADTGKSFGGRTVEDSPAKAPPLVKASTNVRSGRPLLGPDGAPIVIAEAQLTRHVEPDYPSAARRKGVEGYVDVHYTITAKGTVENVTVVGSEPAEVFDKAAMDAVARWRYDPKMVDGVASATEMQVRLQFKRGSKE